MLNQWLATQKEPCAPSPPLNPPPFPSPLYPSLFPFPAPDAMPLPYLLMNEEFFKMIIDETLNKFNLNFIR